MHHCSGGRRGLALITALGVLAVLASLAVTFARMTAYDREAARAHVHAVRARIAAEAGLANARQVVHTQLSRSNPTLPAAGFPVLPLKQTIGTTTLYDREQGNLPSYYGDPNPTDPDPCGAAPPVCYWKKGRAAYEAGVNLSGAKAGRYIWDLYRINVVGESPDGSRVRIEAAEAKMIGDSGFATGGAVYGGG